MISIRPASSSDLPAILDIYNDAVRTTTATFDYEPQALLARVAWYESHIRDNYPIFVAESSLHDIAGWGSLSAYHPRAGYRFTVEDSIYIGDQWRGQGIGKLLLASLVTAASDLKLHAIIASITQGNEASVRLHTSFGFTQVGFMPEVGYKFDRWLDVIYMQLILMP